MSSNCTGPQLSHNLTAGEAKRARRESLSKRRACAIHAAQASLFRMTPSEGLHAGIVPKRISVARQCRRLARDSFVFVPAAAGAHSGTMTVWGSTNDLILGGLTSMKSPRRPSQTVPVVDIVTWLLESFTEEDTVILKMDVEGAEHDIIPKLLTQNATRVVDALLWECHKPKALPSCKDLSSALVKAGVRVMQEPYDFDQWSLDFSPLRQPCAHQQVEQRSLIKRVNGSLALDECKRLCNATSHCGSIVHRSRDGICELRRTSQCKLREGRCVVCLGRRVCNQPCMFVRSSMLPHGRAKR